MRKYELRELCIRNNWFTNGCVEQYEKMFDYNDEINNSKNDIPKSVTLDELHTLAYLIWICSENVTQPEIVEKLIEAESRK
ncbi:MAG: hypothetical protein ACI4LK_09200 [Lentihominibacter sp.]